MIPLGYLAFVAPRIAAWLDEKAESDTNEKRPLEEIVEATGWQRHSVRGFVSILGSKGGMKIASTRRESDGVRVYEA